MKICCIFHSYSGVTRNVCIKLKNESGSDLFEVKPLNEYSKLTAYTKGCLRARKGEKDSIDHESIDISSYDLVIIGTPVWAWKTTPVINAAVNALEGGEGKKAIIFATCGGQPGESLRILKKAVEEKGLTVIGEVMMTKNDINEKTEQLVKLVKDTASNL